MGALHRLATIALTSLDPERAHRLTIRGLKLGLGPRSSLPDDPILATRIGGLNLSNPIGLAPGFDKDAETPDAMLRAGFGFVECGTVTPLPQVGNPKPRLFRLTEDRAVINRMGFNNLGLEAFTRRLAARRRQGVVGANIGANKESTDRVGDYRLGLRRVWGLCDYVTINISSPNTPGLRALQEKNALADLLGAVAETRSSQAKPNATPIFLKVAPDLNDSEAADIVDNAVRFGLNGIIVSNTTIARPDGLKSATKGEIGGLSGAPLMAPSTQMLRIFHQAAAGRLDLIGVGGVTCGADAYAKVRAGARAVQLYSALVYSGPGLADDIRRDLASRLRADGFASLQAAVGAV